LFLLDISMPGMSGLSLLEVLRNKGISVPVIMLSADAYEKTSESLPEENDVRLYDEYITKPVRDSILLDKLANALSLTWRHESDTKKEISNSVASVESGTNSNTSFEGVTEDDYRELISLAEIGFIDGINKMLSRIEKAGESNHFIHLIRSHLVNYQFEKIIDVSKKGLYHDQ